MDQSAEKLITIYQSVLRSKPAWEIPEDDIWHSALRRIQTEWKLISNMAHAAGTALTGEGAPEGSTA